MATETTKSGGKKTAGALDIRNIIGLLLSVYGVILVFMGIFGDKELGKTGDVNANLWAGVGLLVVGGIFLTWAKIRPVIVPADVHAQDGDRPPGH
jgi:LPXTG-motif cell wall-anchored protein